MYVIRNAKQRIVVIFRKEVLPQTILMRCSVCGFKRNVAMQIAGSEIMAKHYVKRTKWKRYVLLICAIFFSNF